MNGLFWAPSQLWHDTPPILVQLWSGAVAEHKRAGKHSSWSILNTIPHLRGVEPSEFCIGYHRSHLDEHDVRSTLFLPANWTRSPFYRTLGGGCCGKCMQHHHMSYHVINHHELRWSAKIAIAHQPEIIWDQIHWDVCRADVFGPRPPPRSNAAWGQKILWRGLGGGQRYKMGHGPSFHEPMTWFTPSLNG